MSLPGFLRILFGIAALPALIGFFFQTKLLFPGGKLPAGYAFRMEPGAEEIRIRTEDGVSLSAMKYGGFGSKKIILYFHGNGGSLESWQYVHYDLAYLKTDMIILDYRGYGKSGGKIGERGLYLDAKALYAYARAAGYADSDIVLYGRSIGSGIAVDLAQGKPIDALILESPYSSLRKMVYREFWFMLPYLYLAYSLNSCEKMAAVTARLLVIHGTRDEVVPFRYGEELFACYAGPKSFLPIEGGGHNDLDRFAEKKAALKAWLRVE
ncbi:MAG TPA: alpha/beta hydrolase [Fibrobacteria bacterium]|nr:alpha/beta hydrolase [Fibrobacteria bacterium]